MSALQFGRVALTKRKGQLGQCEFGSASWKLSALQAS